MRLTRLLDTSTFRLALIYLGLFGVSALTLLGYLYAATAGVMEEQTTETIEAEITGLHEQYLTSGLRGLRRVLEQRSRAHPNRASIYLLTDPAGQRIAGNLDRWPEIDTPSESAVQARFLATSRTRDGLSTRVEHLLLRLPRGG